MTYSLFQCALAKANAEGIKIDASEESLNTLNYQCNTIKDAIIGELKKKLDTSNSTFITDHKTNFYFCFGFTILSIAFLVNGNLHF